MRLPSTLPHPWLRGLTFLAGWVGGMLLAWQSNSTHHWNVMDWSGWCAGVRIPMDSAGPTNTAIADRLGKS